MKVAYVSNYLTAHVRSLAEELYHLLGNDFCFIETVFAERNNKEAFRQGYAYYQAAEMEKENLVWRYRGYTSEHERNTCLRKINESDVVITANADDIWIKQRLKEGKLTFRAHERWYRNSFPWYSFPKRIMGGWIHHRRFKSLYMLCASAYTASDAKRVGCFKNKAYCWGYFPNMKQYASIGDLNKDKEAASILWVGRMIDWKHPEVPVIVAKRLKDNGYTFRLCMIGEGGMKSKIQQMIADWDLSDCVKLFEAMSTEEIRGYMERNRIFLFTSDRNEGWGVVLNESMNSGCAVVASHAIGAAPFLIENGRNGYIYESGNVDELYSKVVYLLDHPDRQEKMGEEAYHTICNTWNAEIAAKRFLVLSNRLLEKKECSDLYKEGPCSVARVIRDDWYS